MSDVNRIEITSSTIIPRSLLELDNGIFYDSALLLSVPAAIARVNHSPFKFYFFILIHSIVLVLQVSVGWWDRIGPWKPPSSKIRRMGNGKFCAEILH